MDLNNKQHQVLASIFINPIPSTILWRDIENLFRTLGADVRQGQGSRVRVKLNDVKAVFHQPHPEKEIDKGAVKSVREFLIKAGFEPETLVNDDE